MTRSAMIAAIVLLCASQAQADDKTPCWKIRAYVAFYGKEAAVKWAKDQNYSQREIERGKRCLK